MLNASVKCVLNEKLELRPQEVNNKLHFLKKQTQTNEQHTDYIQLYLSSLFNKHKLVNSLLIIYMYSYT